jgi:hypothetical protein
MLVSLETQAVIASGGKVADVVRTFRTSHAYAKLAAGAVGVAYVVDSLENAFAKS